MKGRLPLHPDASVFFSSMDGTLPIIFYPSAGFPWLQLPTWQIARLPARGLGPFMSAPDSLKKKS